MAPIFPCHCDPEHMTSTSQITLHAEIAGWLPKVSVLKVNGYTKKQGGLAHDLIFGSIYGLIIRNSNPLTSRVTKYMCLVKLTWVILKLKMKAGDSNASA